MPIVQAELMLDEFVIMPDHPHAIVVIREERNSGTRWGELQKMLLAFG